MVGRHRFTLGGLMIAAVLVSPGVALAYLAMPHTTQAQCDALSDVLVGAGACQSQCAGAEDSDRCEDLCWEAAGYAYARCVEEIGENSLPVYCTIRHLVSREVNLVPNEDPNLLCNEDEYVAVTYTNTAVFKVYQLTECYSF
jgi:hypothetical protein